MCGIAGFFGQHEVAPDVPERMMAELRRRGPDAQHVVTWNREFRRVQANFNNALLHARLSIVDPRPLADQPMSNDAGDVWICYNGEVYDWQADARELSARGIVFRTRSDTEFILRAYETWGLDCLARLRGMFAIAILDLRERRLHLVRDRMGLKPLVYHHGKAGFAFASTVRALLPYLPPDARSLSAEGIDAYLAHRYVPAPRTIFAQALRLENGHCLSFDLATGALSKRRYWELQALSGDWRNALDEAVRIRTIADRPLGLFLSGGIDSTVVASRLAALDINELHAFTAAFPGSHFDESRQAREAADALGLAHLAIEVPDHVGPDFAHIVADLDEPFADPGSFPLWYLARATTTYVKAVLGGDGGDELFGGYKRVHMHLRSAWRRNFRLPGKTGAASLEGKGWRKLRTELSLSWEDAYSLRFSGFTPGQRRHLQPQIATLPATYWRETPRGRTPIETLLAIDFDNYLPEYILRKGDLCTMAHGLELRAPLLDHLWVGHVLAMPASERFTRPPKRVLEQVCPPCTSLGLFAQKKRGFNPPLKRWLDGDLSDRCVELGVRLEQCSGGQLDASAADRLVSHYRRGASHLAEQVLQLVILDESLRQLREAARVHVSSP